MASYCRHEPHQRATCRPSGAAPRRPRHWCWRPGTWIRCGLASRVGTGGGRRFPRSLPSCVLARCSRDFPFFVAIKIPSDGQRQGKMGATGKECSSPLHSIHFGRRKRVQEAQVHRLTLHFGALHSDPSWRCTEMTPIAQDSLTPRRVHDHRLTRPLRNHQYLNIFYSFPSLTLNSPLFRDKSVGSRDQSISE